MPVLLARPSSEERAGGDSWRQGCLFYWPHHTQRWTDSDMKEWRVCPVHVGEFVRVQVFLLRSVMFKWERKVIFLSRVLFFHAVGLHVLAVCQKLLTASIFPSWALEVKGTYQAEDVLHISFSIVHHCSCTPTKPLSVLLPPLSQPLIDWLICVYEKSIGQPFECFSHLFAMDCSYCTDMQPAFHSFLRSAVSPLCRQQVEAQSRLVCAAHLSSELLSNFYDMAIKVTCCLQALITN